MLLAIYENSKDENINTINAFFTALHTNAILIRAEELHVSSKFDLTQFEAAALQVMQQRFDFTFGALLKEVC